MGTFVGRGHGNARVSLGYLGESSYKGGEERSTLKGGFIMHSARLRQRYL